MLAKENTMIEKAVGILEVLSGDEKIRMEAFYREKEIRDKISRISAAGAEGERTKTFAITKNLPAFNLSLDQIAAATGLARKEAESLRSN